MGQSRMPRRSRNGSFSNRYRRAESSNDAGRLVCRDCGARYHKGHWLAPGREERIRAHLAFLAAAPPVVCAACHALYDDTPPGKVIVLSTTSEHHQRQILRVVCSAGDCVAAGAREGVLHIAVLPGGTFEIHATSARLARELARHLEQAFATAHSSSAARSFRVHWQPDN